MFGFTLGGSERFQPIYGRNGQPHSQENSTSLEDATTPAVHSSADACCWWHLWQSPPLLEGWEEGVLLLRYHSWQAPSPLLPARAGARDPRDAATHRRASRRARRRAAARTGE